MRFNEATKLRFHADEGAFSVLTTREYGDSQLTATNGERELFLQYFSSTNICRGAVSGNPDAASKKFYLHESEHPINLNLNFPKSKGNELRLYLKEGVFKPKPNDIWFTYMRKGKIFIGAMTLAEWKQEKDFDPLSDEGEEYLQRNIDSKIQNVTLKERDTYKRNPSISLERLNRAKFLCEVNQKHPFFISRNTKKPYCEAHHFIPMWAQDMYDKPLDDVNNVFCLCPFCHRAIHHAIPETSQLILESLFYSRQEIFTSMFDIKLDEIKSFYKIH